MKILVINSGSSSIKYQLFDMDMNTVLAGGIIEKIGEPGGRLTHTSWKNDSSLAKIVIDKDIPDHGAGLELIVSLLTDPESGAVANKSEISAVAHRVVHGGESFHAPALIDEAVINAIKENVPLAPLHNPTNLTGIEVARAVFPNTPQVAVFDTAFHQTIPPKAFHYGLPYEFYKTHKIRRYGFHGTSHNYVAKEAARLLGRPLDTLNLITIHLGNGSSITAIEKGRSVDTSMGMTPLEGLLMGTRCGDLDPAIYFYLAEYFNMTIPQIESLLNKQSGLKGFCGTNDMREILSMSRDGDAMAKLAIQIYTYRIKKYIGAYYAILGHVDAIVFTAGVGQNAAEIRELTCSGLERLGIIIDPQKNNVISKTAFAIHGDDAEVKVFVIPTNEELEIALQANELVSNRR